MPIDLDVSNELKKSAKSAMLRIADIARQLEMQETEQAIESRAAQLMDDSFRIMVAGRFRNGKSTLLNALLGKPSVPVEGLPEGHGPMPVTYVPTTAVLTVVTYSEKPTVTMRAFDGRTETWTMERYFRDAKVRPDEEENQRFFANIQEFQMGFPAEILRQGVTIIDSPGTDDTPQRSAITNAAARTCDAAIVVFRSDVLAGGSEREFVDNVLTIDGTKNFMVVNLMHGKKADAEFKPWAWFRLVRFMRGGPAYAEQDFTKEDIYFVDAKLAEESKLAGDAAGVAESGLQVLEKQLGDYLVTDRHRQHLEKFVRAVIRLTSAIDDQIRRRSNALKLETDQLTKAYEEIRPALEKVHARSRRIPEIFAKYRRRAARDLADSFEREIYRLENDLPALLTAHKLPSADGVLSLFRQQAMTNEAFAFCKKTISDRIEQWASQKDGGAARALQPAVDELMSEIEHEVALMERVYRDFYLRISGTGAQETKADDYMSWFERALWVAGGVLAHDVGLAFGGAAMGWRGVAATVVGYIGAGIIAVIAGGLSVVTFVPLVVVMALGSNLFAAKMFLADRIKKSVLEKVLRGDAGYVPPRPPLRDVSVTAKPQIETHAEKYFGELETAIMTSIHEILAEEQRNLEAIDASNRKSAGQKSAELTKLKALGNEVETHRKQLDSLVVEAKQAIA
jgi:hypothetical protein